MFIVSQKVHELVYLDLVVGFLGLVFLSVSFSNMPCLLGKRLFILDVYQTMDL